MARVRRLEAIVENRQVFVVEARLAATRRRLAQPRIKRQRLRAEG
jgi:hypothetical protein